MKQTSDSNPNIPEYIREQANNSWQMELFISLGMIFALTKVPVAVSKEFHESFINIELDTLIILGFFGVVTLSRIFLIGFAANLFFRAIWLGMLGIYYVYPKGILYDKLNYSDTFKNYYKPKFKTLDKVKKLEKYSSLSFSLGIFSGIQCLGILLIMTIMYFFIIHVFHFESLDNSTSAYIILFFLILYSNGFFDKMIFGVLKKIKWLNKLYLPVHKVLNILSCNWLIHYERLTIISTSGRWKIGMLSAIYTIAAVVISANDLGMSNTMGFNNITGLDSRQYTNMPAQFLFLQNDEYDDLLSKDDLINVVSIPSEHIKGDLLQIFVTYDKHFDKSFERRAELINLDTKFRSGLTSKDWIETGSKMRSIISQSIYVELNHDPIDSLHWYIRNHPITQQVGFQTTVDISTYLDGPHELVVRPIKIRENLEVDTINGRWIPFMKIRDYSG